MSAATEPLGEPMRPPMMSGHCAFPQTRHPEESHARCRGGQRANPAKVFQPCPCVCHFPYGETYECGSCGGVIILAEHWPLDEDGDQRYTHIDNSGRALGEECGQTVSRNRTVEVITDPEPEPEPVYYESAEVMEADALLAELDADEDEEDEFDALLAEMDDEDF